MTNGEKVQIGHMRKRGLGYTEIARSLGMSVNTVKSYCRRSGVKPLEKKTAQSGDVCRQCGSVLKHTPGRKKKCFCSDACRLRWWHEHRYMSKTAKSTKCAACGRAFMTDRGQRYCSHACYIHMRFGESRGNGTQQAQ